MYDKEKDTFYSPSTLYDSLFLQAFLKRCVSGTIPVIGAYTHYIKTSIESYNTMVSVCSCWCCPFWVLQGNNANKLVVLDSKVCDYINCILRRGNFHKCSDDEVSLITHGAHCHLAFVCSLVVTMRSVSSPTVLIVTSHLSVHWL